MANPWTRVIGRVLNVDVDDVVRSTRLSRWLRRDPVVDDADAIIMQVYWGLLTIVLLGFALVMLFVGDAVARVPTTWASDAFLVGAAIAGVIFIFVFIRTVAIFGRNAFTRNGSAEYLPRWNSSWVVATAAIAVVGLVLRLVLHWG